MALASFVATRGVLTRLPPQYRMPLITSVPYFVNVPQYDMFNLMCALPLLPALAWADAIGGAGLIPTISSR